MRQTTAILSISIGFVCALASAAAHCQDHTDHNDYFGDLPIVLSPARLEQPLLESPSSISVIDAEMIHAIGARDIAELFRNLPGFQVGYFRGNRPVVTYHGLADQFARRMQVLIDGRSIYVSSYGGVPWESIPVALEDIIRIEVIRGPNAASYGPNSFTGVINITTRHSSEDEGVSISSKTGTRNYKNTSISYSPKAADWDYRLSYSYHSDDGFDDVDDDRLIRVFSLRSDYSLNQTDTLALQLGMSNGQTELGEPNEIGDPLRNQEPSYYFHHLRWERNYTADEALTAQYYFNRYTVKDKFNGASSVPIDFGGTVVDVPFSFSVNLDTESERHDIELQYNNRPTEHLRIVSGAGIRLDRVKTPGYLNREDFVENNIYRLFAHFEWWFTDNWSLNAGGMFEHNDITEEEFSPKITLLYKLSPTQTFRMGTSYATRTPVLYEDQAESIITYDLTPPPPLTPISVSDYFNIGTHHLKPETVRSDEIGYRWLSNTITLDVKIFHDHYEDLIVQNEIKPFPEDTVDGKTFIFENQTSADFYGIETQIEITPTEKTRLIGAVSYIDADSKNDNANEDTKRSVPRWTSSLLGIYRLATNSFVSFDYSYMDLMDWADKRQKHASSVRKLDLQYSKGFNLMRQKASFGISLENILGEYVDYDEENIAEPGGYMRFSINFH